MSSFNSPRTAQPSVVRVEDVAIARNVIRAMRSSSNSSRHYKQNATWDDHIITDINQFNRIVTEQKDVVTKTQFVEQQMNEAIAKFIPLSLGDQSKTSPTSPDDHRSPRQATHRACEGDSSDSDSDEDEYSREKRAPGRKLRQSSNQDSGRSSDGAAKGLGAPKRDPDFDSDFDEDPSEMAELMQDFVAPSSQGAQTLRSSGTGGGGGGGGVKGRAQAYKGQSSNTSSSIRFGAGGIRGIQHQSITRDRPVDGDLGMDLDCDAGSVITTATQHSIGASSTVTASKLLHIKPGQAIRVKAPSKRNRTTGTSSSATGADNQHNS